MKIIKNGKVYDTSTARLVAAHAQGYGRDSGKYTEQLYRKRTGEYFLSGEGGPGSKYAEQFGGGWISGSRIIPLSYEQARQWAEEHLDADEYEAEFGAVAEDDSRTTLTLSVTGSAAEAARRAASRAGVSLSAYIEQLITAAPV